MTKRSANRGGCRLNGEIIGRGHNFTRKNKTPLFTLKLKRIRQSQLAPCWRLEDCELFVTLKPCPIAERFCASQKVTFGAFRPKAGTAIPL